MKNPLLQSITWITLVALTATTLYAQTTTGNSVISKMKAAVSAFTLAGDLNPGQTGLQSAPVSGKKTGDILTAGEWNRVLELLGEGGSGGSGSGWVDVPLTDTGDYDIECIYRVKIMPWLLWMHAGPYWLHMSWISTKAIYDDSIGSTDHINSDNKSQWKVNGSNDGSVTITKMEKLCGGGGGGGLALYKCTNAQSLDVTNAPCYGASRNGGAGTNQYRVVSCTDFDGTRSYTMSSILNFWQLVANKWAVSVNGGTIECDDGTVLVMDIQSGWSNSSTTSNLTYINPDNTDFTPLECTPGMNYMINPISFSAESASTYTSKKVAVLKSGNWRLKGTSFDGVRNKNSDSSQTLRINSIIDGVTTQLLNSTVDIGMYIYSLPATSTNYETVSVPAGKTSQIDVSLRNINLRWWQLVAWCTN